MRLFFTVCLWISFLLGGCQSHEKPQTDSKDRAVILTAAREVIQNSGKCAFITLDKKGHPQVRTMDAFEPEADFTVWMATNPNSRKVDQIKSNPHVTLYYSDKNENGYVSIYGMAELVNDQTEKDNRWKEEWKNFYPDRQENYLLIKVTPTRLEVINYNKGINGDSVTWQPAVINFTN
ncbi:MAG: pyridoxamine 5'-phosphate oxidase family protein [Cyclobacteriaceae bacterium]|nr:pyridoxamine 5'-phosphate oxidase family protein [Cyclobacteriaceae bacterium]